MVGLILLLTIVASMGLGVVAGFAAIAAILNSFGRSRKPVNSAPVLAPSSSGGD